MVYIGFETYRYGPVATGPRAFAGSKKLCQKYASLPSVRAAQSLVPLPTTASAAPMMTETVVETGSASVFRVSTHSRMKAAASLFITIDATRRNRRDSLASRVSRLVVI